MTKSHAITTLPARMRVVELAGNGPPSMLVPSSRPVPTPDPGQLLVRVAAVGVCGHDLLARQGQLAATTGDVLGHEIAGTVVAVGDPPGSSGGPPDGEQSAEDLQRWLGSRVALVQRVPCGTCIDCRTGATPQCRQGPGFYGEDLPGGYAEYVLASPLNAVPVPDAVDDATAAVLSCGVGTGLRALNAAQLSPGDVVVVTGAGGGVGLHAVQVATSRGQRVVAVTGTKTKAEALQHTADAVLVRPDVRTLRNTIDQLGGRRGAAAAIETTGSPTFELSLRSLAPGGRLMLIGNVEPTTLPLDPGLTIVKELHVRGSAHATRADLKEVVTLVTRQQVQPMATRTWALEKVARAHEALERRNVTGRAVVLP